jgi:hypothetical protein
VKENIIAKVDVASDEEIRVIVKLLCESAGRKCDEYWWSRDVAERHLLNHLDAMGLRELEDLAALLELPASSPSPEAASEAA